MPILAAYNLVYKYDIICICGTFLDFTISDDDNIPHLHGYNLLGADHPDNIKRGGVFILQKKFKEN